MPIAGSLELCQRIQREPRFTGAIHCCVREQRRGTRRSCAGMFENCGVAKAKTGLRDPVRGHDVAGQFLYDLKPSNRLAEYRARLSADWGSGFRAWVQRAWKLDKLIIETRSPPSRRCRPPQVRSGAHVMSDRGNRGAVTSTALGRLEGSWTLRPDSHHRKRMVSTQMFADWMHSTSLRSWNPTVTPRQRVDCRFSEQVIVPAEARLCKLREVSGSGSR